MIPMTEEYEEWIQHDENGNPISSFEKKIKIDRVELVPTSSPDLVRQYIFFRDTIYNPRRVFYPSCNADISPLESFLDAQVTLMDKDPQVAQAMRKHSIREFVEHDVLTYVPPSEFDLVIALNPCINSSDLTKYLRQSGYVLANNYHNNASQLLEDEDFTGIGTLIQERNKIRLQRDFSRLVPMQFETLLYFFQKR
ncbi:MAG: hypothetical protein ACMXYC_00040 [Candidatus Woesearchaeota archaeon]